MSAEARYPEVDKSSELEEIINGQVGVDTGLVPSSPLVVTGFPLGSVPRYRQYPKSPDPPTLSAPAIQEKYGFVELFQPLAVIDLPVGEVNIRIEEALVVGGVES
jgi:hypothetical protein